MKLQDTEDIMRQANHSNLQIECPVRVDIKEAVLDVTLLTLIGHKGSATSRIDFPDNIIIGILPI